jgi:hypothetical protein
MQSTVIIGNRIVQALANGFHSEGIQTMILSSWVGTSGDSPIATALARKGYRVLVSLATVVPFETGAGTYSNISVRTRDFGIPMAWFR